MAKVDKLSYKQTTVSKTNKISKASIIFLQVKKEATDKFPEEEFAINILRNSRLRNALNVSNGVAFSS